MAAVLAGAALAASPPAAADEDPGPLPWRVRGAVPFTLDAAAFPDSAGDQLEVYLRVPPPTLRALERDGEGRGRLRLAVELLSRFGARQHEARQEFTIGAGDTVPGFGKIILLRFPVRAGEYRLRARLEDPQSRRRGLAYIGRRVPEAASVEGPLTVDFGRGGIAISDIEFVWAEAGPGLGRAFRRGATALLANPERLYGLLAPELQASFVARAAEVDGGAWRWTARVVDADGRVVATEEGGAPAGRRLDGRAVLDVASLPAGGYDLEVVAGRADDPWVTTRRARFSVAWQLGSWLVAPAALDDLVHFLLSPAEERHFARLQPGERERFLEVYWRERDPTPDTAENEARNEFLARVAHANASFGRVGIGRGMFTDMGRVYIRYGEPSEILRQVIPTGDQTLLQAIRELEIAEDRPTGDVHMKGIGGDQRAFEIWVYEGDIPLPLHVRPDAVANLRPRRRLVFLFVDEHGYGEYALRYSTE